MLSVYSNTLRNPFIWDDNAIIVHNSLIQDWHLLGKAFTSDLFYGVASGSNFYRPLQTISYMSDYYFWGLKPLGYHITNILLQAALSFLVFIFLFMLSGRAEISFFSALLFAVNPLHTESVTYLSGRAEMLMGIFLLTSFIFFVKGQNCRKNYRLPLYLLSVVAFILGLLSKELAVVFPLAILAYLFYFRKSNKAAISWKTSPFFVISLVYVLLRLTLLKFPTFRPPTLAGVPFLFRMSVLFKALFMQAKLLILPVNLHMSYQLVMPTTFLGIFLSWFISGVVVVFAAYILRNKKKNALFCFLFSWYLIFLLPQSGILPINAFFAEHFLYLSSISFLTGVLLILQRYLKKPLFLFSFVCLFAAYGVLTYARNLEWSSPLAFFQGIVKLSPGSFQGYNNLGLEYEKNGDYQKAISCYKRALQIMPELLDAHFNLANLYFKTGKLKEALDEYSVIEKTHPGDKSGQVQNNIGNVLEAQGLPQAAIKRYKIALQLDKNLYYAHFNLARIYMGQGKTGSSVEEIVVSLGLQVDNAETDGVIIRQIITRFLEEKKMLNSADIFYNNLGAKLAGSGIFYAAASAFKRALEIEPAYEDAHFNLALSYLKMGMRNRAVSQLNSLLKIDPQHHRARSLLLEIKKNVSRSQ